MTNKNVAPHSAFKVYSCDSGGSVLLIHHQDSFYLFDSWLSDSYFVLHPAFYSSKRVQRVNLPIEKLPPLQGLFLSSIQNDHCHLPSLAEIAKKNPSLPVWTDSAIACKIKKIPSLRANTHRCQDGERIFINDSLSAIKLQGYGGSSPYILQDIKSNESICIAPHGINWRWTKKDFPLLSSLFIGITPVLLSPFGLGGLRFLMPDRGINIPLPTETMRLINELKIKNIYPIHQTIEDRRGWAVRNLIEFPWKVDVDVHNIGTEKARLWLIKQCPESSFLTLGDIQRRL